jgi:2-iminoacetate synthase
MAFAEYLSSWKSFDFDRFTATIDDAAVSRVLRKQTLTEQDFLTLLSEKADRFLEEIARKAAQRTRLHFGNAVMLFTPMYISNHCENVCPYCSFARHHDIVRGHLSLEEIAEEARRICSTGMRHILLLTGEAPAMVPVDHLEGVIRLLRNYFSSVAIEIYPLTGDDYRRLIDAGADSLTLYQETYDRQRYERLHRGGPKADYLFRLGAPERAAESGIRTVTVGALYGLSDWRSDAFYTALHARYLQQHYPAVDIALSFPRLRPQAGDFTPRHYITDRQFVRLLVASRLFLPAAGITMSTREAAPFRMSVLPLGVTKMSAGVSTSVGGHGGEGSTPQFEIADNRSVTTIRDDLLAAGFQPVMHDWNRSLTA